MLVRPISLVTRGSVIGREPDFAGPGATTTIRLPAHAATMVDCCRIMEFVPGPATAGQAGVSIGVVEIVSSVDLAVTAVYTTGDGSGGVPAIDVQQIAARGSTGAAIARSEATHE